MYTLSLKGKFSASHRLVDYDGDCSNLHGHTWKYKIKIEGGEPDYSGIIVDFRSLKNIVKEWFDHTNLNDSLNVDNPTAEFIAGWLWSNIYDLMNKEDRKFSRIKVTIWESDDAKVSYG